MSGKLQLALSLESGGCIKFDPKAWDETLHKVLAGIANKRTNDNFATAGKKVGLRPLPPLLIASTLLVPGHIDDEVRTIAAVAKINPAIPYSLLAFATRFFLSDLPVTSRALAEGCAAVAREEGLTNVHIGNIHLLQ